MYKVFNDPCGKNIPEHKQPSIEVSLKSEHTYSFAPVKQDKVTSVQITIGDRRAFVYRDGAGRLCINIFAVNVNTTGSQGKLLSEIREFPNE